MIEKDKKHEYVINRWLILAIFFPVIIFMFFGGLLWVKEVVYYSNLEKNNIYVLIFAIILPPIFFLNAVFYLFYFKFRKRILFKDDKLQVIDEGILFSSTKMIKKNQINKVTTIKNPFLGEGADFLLWNLTSDNAVKIEFDEGGSRKSLNITARNPCELSRFITHGLKNNK